MRLSRRRALLALAIALSFTLLLVTLLQTRAEPLRLVRWWAGGEQVAFKFGERCTDTLSLDFYARPEPDDDLSSAQITWRSERTGASYVETPPVEACDPQANACPWELQVWNSDLSSFETLTYTHRIQRTFDLSNLNTNDPDDAAKLGDRIEVDVAYAGLGIEDFYVTLDCTPHTNEFISSQGDGFDPAPPSEIGSDDECTAGELIGQYEMDVSDSGTVDALDVAMHFRSQAGVEGLRAELTSPNGTTIALWDNFTAGPEVGERCETSLQGDPMADFVLTDQSVWPLPADLLNVPDRAYQPREALAAFAGEPLQGVWTLNICRTAPLVPEIPNGSFEGGSAAWSQYSSNGYPLIYNSSALPIAPHGGNWAAWLGGAHNEVSQLSQTIPVPDEVSVLSYYHNIISEDYCGYDYARVYANGVLQSETDMCQTTDGWEQQTLDLSAYAGATVNLTFEVETDDSRLSNQFIDDVAWYTESQAETLPRSRTVPEPDAAPQKSPDVTSTQPAGTAPQGGGDEVQCWYLNFKNTTLPEYKTFLPALQAD